MIKGISGIIIWTENLDRLVTFYTKNLGLIPHSHQTNFVAFKFGDIRLNLGYHPEVRAQTNEPYRIMINLGVLDIHSTYQQLLAQGIDFLRPPEQEHWGGWIATFADSDGNLLQLLQQPTDNP